MKSPFGAVVNAQRKRAERMEALLAEKMTDVSKRQATPCVNTTFSCVNITVRRELFRFNSEAEWRGTDKGHPALAYRELKLTDIVMIDNAGRICVYDTHFIRATSEDTYPVVVYEIV